MSTVPYNGNTTGPLGEPEGLPHSLSHREPRNGPPDLTIHRLSLSHHGHTLRMLGHAAEYLVSSRIFSPEIMDAVGDLEAIHILMGLSREVFDEYAATATRCRPFSDWLMSRAVRFYGAA